MKKRFPCYVRDVSLKYIVPAMLNLFCIYE